MENPTRLQRVPPAPGSALKRRMISFPTWYLASILSLSLAPVGLPLLVLWDLIRRQNLVSTRTALYFACFFWIETIGVSVAGVLWVWNLFVRDARRYEMANRRLQWWWSRNLFWTAVKLFSVEVDIDGLELLEDRRPSLVLSRHASTLDTMLPLATVRHMKLFRYVIKAELLMDPAMDVVAQRFPNAFVQRGGGDPEAEIERVLTIARGMEENAAIVMYPEGTRFTPAKRARLLEKFEETDPEMYELSKRLEHTLPPLREGAVRLVQTTTDCDVVIVAHRGIGRAGAMSDLIKGKLLGNRLEVKIWRIPADEVPRDRDGVRAFLVEQWQKVEDYVARKPEGEAEPLEYAAVS